MDFDVTVDGLGTGELLNGYSISLVDDRVHNCMSQLDAMRLKSILDVFSRLSAKAQGLSGPITDLLRARTQHHNLYIAARREGKKTTVFGYIKTGRKKLFVTTTMGRFEEIEPVCVLDFYVHESCQRTGIGRALFEAALEGEQEAPETLAYDRPSPKLLSFLRRHYGLHEYLPQANNFVVFRQYWDFKAAMGKLKQDDPYATISMRPLTAQRDRRFRKEVEGKTVLDESKQKAQFTLRQGFFDHHYVPSPTSPPGPSPFQRSPGHRGDASPSSPSRNADVDSLTALMAGGAKISDKTTPGGGRGVSRAPSSLADFTTGTSTSAAAYRGTNPATLAGAAQAEAVSRTAQIKALAGEGAKSCFSYS